MKFKNPFSKNHDLDEEIEAHIALKTDYYLDQGMTEEEARKAALREFGNAERLKEECRDSWGMRVLSEWLQDIRFAWRQIRKQKGYSVLVAGTFAVCLGLNIAMFNIYNSTVINPRQYENENRIVNVYETYDDLWGDNRVATSRIYWKERSEQAKSFEAIAIFGVDWANVRILGIDEVSDFTGVARITPSLFEVLGTQPFTGRALSPGEGYNEALLNYDYWQKKFDGRSEILGKTIQINNSTFEIIGVMPKGFALPRSKLGNLPPDVYTNYGAMTFSFQPEWRIRPFGMCVALLKPGTTLSQAEIELNQINLNNGPNYPEQFRIEQEQNHKTVIIPLGKHLVRDFVYALDLLKFGLIAILLIGSINITSLLVSRHHQRSNEFASRIAVGASRFRIAKQLITESTLLAVCGVLGGFVLAILILNGLSAIGLFDNFTIPPRDQLDLESWVFGIILSVIIGSLIGAVSLLPMFRGSSHSHNQRTSSFGKSYKYFQGSSVAIQLSIALLLLISSILMFLSFRQAMRIDPGFDPDGLFTAGFRPAVNDDTKRLIIDKFFAEKEKYPELESVAISNWPPLKLGGLYLRSLYVEGDNSPTPYQCFNDTVSPSYFETLGIPILQGRTFNPSEVRNQSAVAIIDKKLADRHFPGQNPIGKRISIPSEGGSVSIEESDERNWLTIIGVTQTIRNRRLVEAPTHGTVFTNLHRQTPYWNGVMVRSQLNETRIAEILKKIVGVVAPETGLAMPKMMTALIEKQRAPQKALSVLCTIITSVSLTLCAIGVIGNVSYTVSTQTKEIGIRLTLGAKKFQLLLTSTKFWLKTGATGLICGAIAALFLSPFIETYLYEVEARSISTFLSAILFLFIIVSLASLISARKGMSLNPVEALRSE